MIGRITGILVYNIPPKIMLEVNGIGYEIDCPMSTIYMLPSVNQVVTIHTQLIIREDGHYLYGFIDESQKQMFKELIRVSGIGSRTALAILSGLEVSDIIYAIENHQINLLSTIPGIGKKSAERLILELSGRLKGFLSSNHVLNNTNKNDNVTTSVNNNIKYDTLNALLALGYAEKEANNAIKKIDNLDSLNISQAIKQALNILSKY